MIIAGKAPPEAGELREVNRAGFNHVELYLEKRHLDDIDESIDALENSDLEVVSVHTPHVTLEDKEYFEKADKLASEFDAFLVFHSQFLHHVHIPRLENLTIKSDYGYENNPGSSVRLLESMILKPGHNMVLDTAHLYMATEDYLQTAEYFLDRYRDQIPVIHLCDSTRRKDGLAFGAGEMEMGGMCRVIDESEFDGILVLEVMPEGQEAALEKWNEYTD